MSFERLMREHDALERMGKALLAIVARDPDPQLACLMLGKFALSIKAHRAFEQSNVYRPLVQIARDDLLGGSVDLRLLTHRMERDWSAYLDGWTLESIAADWAGFARHTHDIVSAGLERLRFENKVIYPLALRHGTITLVDAA